jgi:solute carrier family 66, member 2
LALGIEALLPIPQFLSNYRHKSVSGFRPSVVIAWLAGDIFKTSYFFFGEANVTWQFKMCAVVQFVFDIGIAVQFCVYGGKSAWTLDGKLGQEIEQELEEGLGGMRR